MCISYQTSWHFITIRYVYIASQFIRMVFQTNYKNPLLIVHTRSLSSLPARNLPCPFLIVPTRSYLTLPAHNLPFPFLIVPTRS